MNSLPTTSSITRPCGSAEVQNGGWATALRARRNGFGSHPTSSSGGTGDVPTFYAACIYLGAALTGASSVQPPAGRYGPYVIKEFEPGGRLAMQANASYFRGAPKIKRIVLTAVEDENARVALLEKGTIDRVTA